MNCVDVIYNCDCLEGLRNLPSDSIDCCVTSPPYFNLRDYGVANQIGLEDTPEQYIQKLVNVFHEVKRVLTPSGTLWVNIGDSYAGSGKGAANYSDNAMKYKQCTNKGSVGCVSTVKKISEYKKKDLIGIPWMLAFALRNDGWYLRQDIIWSKPNPMPESVTDRCTKSHEYIFLLSKSSRYFFDSPSIKQPAKLSSIKRLSQDIASQKGSSRALKTNGTMKAVIGDRTSSWPKVNKRSVWEVSVNKSKSNHFATFPEKLILDCIKAGCPVNGVVLDPFMGSGTTAVVACKLGRHFIGFELNPDYVSLSRDRLRNELGVFAY